MNSDTVINLLIKHGLINEEDASFEDIVDLVDEEMEPFEMALEILSEVASDKLIFYSLGDNCDAEELVESFAANIDEIIEISDGKIQISDLQLQPPLDSGGEVDEGEDMTISFTWNGREYSWTFSLYENDEFVEGFTKWVYEALDGDFMFVYEDHPFGYHINKNLIKDLEDIGATTHLDMWD